MRCCNAGVSKPRNMAEQGHLMLVAHTPGDDRVEVTIEQLEHLLSTIRDGQYDIAIMWLMAAIRQAKQDVRDRGW